MLVLTVPMMFETMSYLIVFLPVLMINSDNVVDDSDDDRTGVVDDVYEDNDKGLAEIYCKGM